MNTQRVCLVIPPSPFLLNERVFMSLGVLKVAAVVKECYPVDVLDLSGIANCEEVICEYLAGKNPSAIGLTVTTPQLPVVVKIVAAIRKKGPGVRIILGGPHITLTHASFCREEKNRQGGRATRAFRELEGLADVLVAGDGEKAIFEALGPNPPKVINADDPASPLFLKNKELDCLPWPDRELVDVGSYRYTIDGERALSVVSQLGCPFGCGFCGGRYSASFNRARSRSVRSVLSEVEYLYRQYGMRGVMFYDDELNINHDLIVGLMTGLIGLQRQLGTELRLRGFVRASCFNEEQARLMYQAGFRWILVGFESGSDEMLLNMNKGATVEDNMRCIEIAHAHDLKVKALMSLGHPGESPDSAEITRDWLLQVQPDDLDVAIITVYPGTDYYDESVPSSPGIWVYTCKAGDRLYSREIDYGQIADFYKGDPNDGYQAHVFTDFLSSPEIVSWRDQIEREVRAKLGISFPTSAPAGRFEHRSGQNGLSGSVLRSS